MRLVLAPVLGITARILHGGDCDGSPYNVNGQATGVAWWETDHNQLDYCYFNGTSNVWSTLDVYASILLALPLFLFRWWAELPSPTRHPPMLSAATWAAHRNRSRAPVTGRSSDATPPHHPNTTR